jgi:hypothetical protein
MAHCRTQTDQRRGTFETPGQPLVAEKKEPSWVYSLRRSQIEVMVV